MKYILPILFFAISTSLSGQTKEDVLTCLDLIFQQDEFQPAYSNDLVSNGAVVIMVNGSTNSRRSSFEQIKSSLTQDDFRDFDNPVKVVGVGKESLQQLGIEPQYTLEFWMSGTAEQLNIVLYTFVKNDNLRYQWTYQLNLEDEEWQIESRNLDKQRQ